MISPDDKKEFRRLFRLCAWYVAGVVLVFYLLSFLLGDFQIR